MVDPMFYLHCPDSDVQHLVGEYAVNGSLCGTWLVQMPDTLSCETSCRPLKRSTVVVLLLKRHHY